MTARCFLRQVLRKMVNEKIKQLEESYNEKTIIIPDLEKKITTLENENRYLQEHAKRLQEMLTKIATEYQKQQKQQQQQQQVGSKIFFAFNHLRGCDIKIFIYRVCI